MKDPVIQKAEAEFQKAEAEFQKILANAKWDHWDEMTHKAKWLLAEAKSAIADARAKWESLTEEAKSHLDEAVKSVAEFFDSNTND